MDVRLRLLHRVENLQASWASWLCEKPTGGCYLSMSLEHVSGFPSLAGTSNSTLHAAKTGRSAGFNCHWQTLGWRPKDGFQTTKSM